MEVIAWTGVGIVVCLLVIAVLVWLVGMLGSPIGRAIVFVWTGLGVIGWAIIGGIYLLWTHGG